MKKKSKKNRMTGYVHVGKGLLFSENPYDDLDKLGTFLLTNYINEIKGGDNVVDAAIRLLKERLNTHTGG